MQCLRKPEGGWPTQSALAQSNLTLGAPHERLLLVWDAEMRLLVGNFLRTVHRWRGMALECGGSEGLL